MNTNQKLETVDLDSVRKTITRFITGKLNQSGSSGYVLGLSGGVDSALAACLAVEAVGKAKVLAVLLPYKSSSPSSIADAEALVKQLGIESRKVDITAMVDAYFENVGKFDNIRAGNKMARERMSILFDIAQETGRLVMGTGNRTESCLGYTTWFGDSACSMNPIGELYKTEVRALSKLVGVPESIIKKHPTADLWAGQTDENEIGVTYEILDKVLKRIVDDDMLSMEQLKNEGFNTSDISRIVSMLNRNSFKRRQPDVAPIGRTIIPEYVQLSE